MAGAIRNDTADDLFSQQRQIADQIKNLVPHKLIREAQGTIFHAIIHDNNYIVFSCTADEAHIPHGLLLTKKSERPGWRQFLTVEFARKIDFKCLPPNRTREINLVTY